MGLFAIFAPIGKLDIPVPREMRYYLPFIAAGGAVSGALILWRAFNHGGMSYLRLSTRGFEFVDGLLSAHGEWEQVNDVTDRKPHGRTPNKGAIVVVMRDGQTPTFSSSSSYTEDNQALRRMVRFYWQHPECRVELTDGRALARLSSNSFKAD